MPKGARASHRPGRHSLCDDPHRHRRRQRLFGRRLLDPLRPKRLVHRRRDPGRRIRWQRTDAVCQPAAQRLRLARGRLSVPVAVVRPYLRAGAAGQIIWQELSFSEANDGLGPVGVGSISGCYRPAGSARRWTFVSADETVWQPYCRPTSGATGAPRRPPRSAPRRAADRASDAAGVRRRRHCQARPPPQPLAQGGYQYANESGPNPYRRDSVKGDIGVPVRVVMPPWPKPIGNRAMMLAERVRRRRAGSKPRLLGNTERLRMDYGNSKLDAGHVCWLCGN